MPYYKDEHCTIYNGDCVEVMKSKPDNSIDTIITDPPYALEFMGKSWDKILPSKETWVECLRVVKPGAFLLAFGGTRTYHRLTCAIEDAGWEIRDCLMWLYGSGFPKSLDISKAIDKAKGKEREVVGIREDFKKKKASEVRRGTDNQRNYNERHDPGRGGFCDPSEVGNITAPATPEAQLWTGWGTALKPAYEPIIVAMKPMVEPALDIFQSVVYTLENNGLENITWTNENATNVARSSRKKTFTSTPQPKMEEVYVKSVNGKGKQVSGQDTMMNSIADSEHGTMPTVKGQTLIEESLLKNCETKSLKHTGANANVVEKLPQNSSRLTMPTMTENNIESGLVMPTSTGICESEDSQRTDTDCCATTVIVLEAVTESALTIRYENKQYQIKRLPNGSLVWPHDLPKHRPARKSTFANNALKWGVGGLNIDGGRIPHKNTTDLQESVGKNQHENYKNPHSNKDSYSGDYPARKNYSAPQGRFPANLILDEEAAEMLDEMSVAGGLHGAGKIRDAGEVKHGEHSSMFGIDGHDSNGMRFGDSGGASRFFKIIKESSWNQNNVNIVDNHSSQQSQVEDFVLSLVAIEGNPEDKRLKDLIQPFMSEIRKELKRDSEKSIVKIQNTGKKCLQELKQMSMEMLNDNPVKYAEIQRLTSTMMTIQNLLNIDGFVEVVTLNTILKNTVLGEKGSGPLRFKYQAKASKAERNAGCEGLPEKPSPKMDGGEFINPMLGVSSKATMRRNSHPTVKPLKLMEYLIKLTSTPTGGIVLDPFAGSGTTGVACKNLGRKCILIEKDLDSCEIAKARILNIKQKPILFKG